MANCWSPGMPFESTVDYRRSTYKPIWPPPPFPTYKEELFELTKEALNYFNSNHKDHFEFVDPLYMRVYRRDGYRTFFHLSFIARPTGSSLKCKLFYAELSSPAIVKICTIVEPGAPFFPAGCFQCHHDGVIYHPIVRCERGDCCSLWELGSREKSAKKLLWNAYTSKSNVEELNAEEVEELKRTISGYAETALFLYNRWNHTSFELLEPVAGVRFGCSVDRHDPQLWVHFIFKAVNNDRTCTDASPVLFFAELGLIWPSVYPCITTCVIVPNANSSSYSGTGSSCLVCREHGHGDMFHPKDGCVAGLEGGTFSDALGVDLSLAKKVEFEPIVNSSSFAAREEYLKEME